MGYFVVAEFLLTSASRGSSAIAEPLVNNTLSIEVAAVEQLQISMSERAAVWSFQ